MTAGGSRSGPDQDSRTADRRADWPLAAPIGLAALVFSALYLLSDGIEAAQGGFTVGQLWLTLAAEAAIPVFVVGLALAQRPCLGKLGWASAWAYAYSFVFFTGTVVYALVRGIDTYSELTDQLGPLMVAHGALMVVAGVGFGTAVLRAQVLPGWTAVALIIGVVLVALTQTMPTGAGLAAAAIRDTAFAGMGASLLQPGRRRRMAAGRKLW
jgi:hypothetical protein